MNYKHKENYNASQHDAKLNPVDCTSNFYLAQLLQVLVKALVHSPLLAGDPEVTVA